MRSGEKRAVGESRDSGSKARDRARFVGGRGKKGRGEGARRGNCLAALGRSEPHGSPGRQQTLGGDVTPELETMINMIICIKSEWVLFSGRMPRMMNGSGSQIDG